MSPEAKARIAEAVKASAARKRLEMGIAPTTGEPTRTRPLELVRMKDQLFDPILFEPMATGKPVDKLFTNDGGIPRATNYMVVGDPGVGKSTVTLDILSDLAGAGQKVLFISAEMTRIDLGDYDPHARTLLVRRGKTGKSGKSRLLPVGGHPHCGSTAILPRPGR